MAGPPPGPGQPGSKELQLQRASIPELVQEYNLSAPLKGLLEGVDAALMDSLYPPLFSPDIENLRTASGRWEARLGQILWKTLPGSGNPRSLWNLYTADGTVTRLAARGTGAAAVFYEQRAETTNAFASVALPAGVAAIGSTTQPYFQGTTIGDKLVWTDRAGPLLYYTRTGNAGAGSLTKVTNGAAPANAPLVRSRWFDRLETWGASRIAANWPAAANYHLADSTAANPPPGGGNSANLLIDTTGATGQTITYNGPPNFPLSLPSHTIAFWTLQSIDTKTYNQFGIGIQQADEYSLPLRGAAVNSWYPAFFPIGDIGSINFMRFRVLDASRAQNGIVLSALYLPGRLEGSYRWIYTYYNATTGIESGPSPVSNGGVATDFSTIGATNDLSTGRAFQKSAALSFTAAGSPQKIRVYRSGGVAELTLDERGFAIWYRVGEIWDFATTLTNSPAAGANSFTVTAATHISVGDTLVIESGVMNKEEFVTVTAVASLTITVKGQDANGNLIYSHAATAPVQVAFIDNTANESIDTTLPVDLQRNDPPAGALFVQRSPEGRLWIFGFANNPTGVAVSNRPTPDRPSDYFTFPDNVDPLTRRSITQGWRFKVGGDNTDEAIVWGGFFNEVPVILTKRHLYTVSAQSQTDWGPIAVPKRLDIGCIAGDTVVQVSDTLMWVADGPRVVQWRGGSHTPEIVSFLKVNERLNAAPAANWGQWFARAHAKQKNNYYCLYFVPAGQTTCTQRLDYLVDQFSLLTHEGTTVMGDSWEPTAMYGLSGSLVPMYAAVVRDGGSDDRTLYQVDGSGNIFQTEQGTLDNNVPIKVRGTTKRVPLAIFSRFPTGALGDVAPGSTRHIALGQVTMLTQLFLRYAAVTDTLTISVTAGGSEYGVINHTYTVDMSGSGDKETKLRLHRDLYGRWAQVQITGNMSNGPAVREMILFGLPIRAGAILT